MPRARADGHHPTGGEGWTGDLLLGKHVRERQGSGSETDSSSASRRIVANYDLLVIDRDEPNAFSFGFGVDSAESVARDPRARGVVVVYTGEPQM